MRASVLVILLFTSTLGFSQARRAQALIDKEKSLEAYDLLVRSIDKDSLSSAEHFVLASLLINPAFDFYDIDSAYWQVNEAITEFNNLEEKHQARLISSGFTLINYDTLKRHIETAGFTRAINLGREEDYIAYMELFPGSTNQDSAIVLRDKEAFITASAVHTYTSYNEFLDTYPDAIDALEAETRYQALLYESKTASGKLQDFKDFLTNYPETWHRKEAEQFIFDIMAGQNTIVGYQDFSNEFPSSHLTKQAKLSAYSIASEIEQNNFLGSEYFTKKEQDSLQQLQELNNKMILLNHNGKRYELITASGSIVLDSIMRISEQNKCTSIDQLFMTLAPGSNKLINLNGDIIFSGEFDAYQMVAPGFVELITKKKSQIIRIDGTPTTNRFYDAVYMSGGFIIFEEEGKWGIESVTGRSIMKAHLDSIYQFNNYLVSSKSGKWGMHQIPRYYPLLDNQEVTFTYPYDSLSIVRNDEIFIQVGSQTGLLDMDLKPILALGEPEIELLDKGYFLETNDSILDSRLGEIWYSDLRFNENWTIGVRRDKTDIYYEGDKLFEVEDAELLGSTAIRVVIEGQTICYFNAKDKISIKSTDQIKPIRKMGDASLVRHYLYTDQKNKQSVINQNGKRVKIPRFDRLIDLGEDYMIFSIKGFVYNIIDNDGNVILENVDAATSLDQGYITYLSKGKFGLFNIRNSTLIKPKYDKPLKRYNDDLFVISSDGFLGLIDRKDSLYLTPKYEEIRMINDSITALKSNFRWTFWNIDKGQILLDNVSDYWEYKLAEESYFKIFKGIGYGVWNSSRGMILNSTYSELDFRSQGKELVLVSEKWVEEADIVILLYYNKEGQLIRKSVLTTDQYERLQCQAEY